MTVHHAVRRINNGTLTGFRAEQRDRAEAFRSSPTKDIDIIRRRHKGGGSIGGIVGGVIGAALAPATGGLSLALATGLGAGLGTMAGGMALDGQGFGDALKSGVVSGALGGLGAGLGGLAAGQFAGAGMGDLASKALGYGVAGLGTGALGAALTGGNVAKGALLGGALGAGGGALSSFMGSSSGTSGEAAGAAPETGTGADLSGATGAEASMGSSGVTSTPLPEPTGGLTSLANEGVSLGDLGTSFADTSFIGAPSPSAGIQGVNFYPQPSTVTSTPLGLQGPTASWGGEVTSSPLAAAEGLPASTTSGNPYQNLLSSGSVQVDPWALQTPTAGTGYQGVQYGTPPTATLADVPIYERALNWAMDNPIQAGVLGVGALSAFGPMLSSPKAAQAQLPQTSGTTSQYWNTPLPSYDYGGQNQRGRIAYTGPLNQYGRSASPSEHIFFNPVVSSPVSA